MTWHVHPNKEVGKCGAQLKESQFRGITTISTKEGHGKRCSLLDVGCGGLAPEEVSCC